MKGTRREFLFLGAACASAPALAAARKVRITAIELISVRATARTVWLIVRLQSDAGLTGLGEASDAFGFANTTKEDAARMESELRAFFQLVAGRSPIDVEQFRQAGEARARAGGLVAATAFSAIEQALWDLAAQSLDVPVYAMFGGKVRDSLPVYANINRATQPRTPAGFAGAARRAVSDGFQALKAAPFDGFPKPGSPRAEIDAAVNQGIASVAAMREAVGSSPQIMVDCHSFFDVAMAVDVARRMEAQNLTWYEEPVAPERVDETVEIHRAIRQPMAGGELLFGVRGFEPLCSRKAVDVIMPDPKHCGGLLELSRIAGLAEAYGITVAPHNPSGPISTAANVQVSAGMKNFRILELQWGETPWRAELVDPPEEFVRGTIAVPDRAGLGIQLNDRVARAHPI